jgi:hypothetical protein
VEPLDRGLARQQPLAADAAEHLTVPAIVDAAPDHHCIASSELDVDPLVRRADDFSCR